MVSLCQVPLKRLWCHIRVTFTKAMKSQKGRSMFLREVVSHDGDIDHVFLFSVYVSNRIVIFSSSWHNAGRRTIHLCQCSSCGCSRIVVSVHYHSTIWSWKCALLEVCSFSYLVIFNCTKVIHLIVPNYLTILLILCYGNGAWKEVWWATDYKGWNDERNHTGNHPWAMTTTNSSF